MDRRMWEEAFDFKEETISDNRGTFGNPYMYILEI